MHIAHVCSELKTLSSVQDFAGLQATGELDPETLELMNTPRCGIKDRVGLDEEDREQYR